MSRGRLSDCSGSTTGKMEVRVLTHSQAVSSACERRESVACARKGSLRLLLCPGARVPGEKKRPRARGVVDLVRRSSRSEQKRFTGCVMTEECPCSPREATLGASPRRRTAAGRACVSIIPRRTDPGGGARRNECRCSFRGSSASRTSRPRRGTPHECGPLSKRAPIAGVLRPLLQVTFCERAANETRVASSTRRGVFLRRRMTKKKRKTALAAPRTAAEGPDPPKFSSVERW